MDLEKIEGLVKIIEDSSLNEFTYKDKDALLHSYLCGSEVAHR